jgi:hypothetical protein
LALSAKYLWTEIAMIVVSQPPILLDPAPCNSFSVPKTEVSVQKKFKDVVVIKEKFRTLLVEFK